MRRSLLFAAVTERIAILEMQFWACIAKVLPQKNGLNWSIYCVLAQQPGLCKQQAFFDQTPVDDAGCKLAYAKFLSCNCVCRFPHVLGTNIIVDDVLLPDKLEQKKKAVQEFMKKR